MRVIGLLGGMSWESTAVYYRLLNQQVRDRLGGLHSARVLLKSVDFAEIERLQAAGDWDSAAQVLGTEARRLVSAGAQVLVLCTNTMHRVAGAVEQAAGIALLDIVDVTAAALHGAGHQRVAVLGTRYTMESDFLVGRLHERDGFEVLVPEPPGRELVHRIIYDELCAGIVRDESREAYRREIAQLVERGAQALVLACTEIDLLIGPEDADVPLYDTTALHARAAVEAALTDAPDEVTPVRVDHLVLTVADVDKTARWYRDVLGLRPVTFADGRRALEFGAHKINLHQAGHEFSPHAARPVPGSADVCLVAGGGLAAVREHLGRLGVETELGPVERTGALGPMQSVYLRDPDGNLVEIADYE